MSDDPTLLPLYVDWNTNTGTDDDQEAYCINFGVSNPRALKAKLKVGSKIMMYDVELRLEGILHRSSRNGQWLGVPTPESMSEEILHSANTSACGPQRSGLPTKPRMAANE